MTDLEKETIRDFKIPQHFSGNVRPERRRKTLFFNLTKILEKRRKDGRRKKTTKHGRAFTYTVFLCFRDYKGDINICDIPFKLPSQKELKVKDILTFSFVEAENKAESATAKRMHDIRTIHPVVLMKKWMVVKKGEVVHIKPLITQICF